jgi:hypothetical protein
VWSDQPEYLTNMNLQMYENLTAMAGKQGAQVLVFPEFGLEPIHDAARTDLYAYAMPRCRDGPNGIRHSCDSLRGS